MPELTASTREAARRLGVSDTAIHKAERAGRIAREPDGQWDIDKTRRLLTETADPARSPLASSAGADGTPFARLKVAQLALKVEAQRLSLDETKRRLVDVTEANAALDEIGSTMRDALLNWPARVSGLIAAEISVDTARQGVIEGVPTLQGIGLGEAGEPVGYWLHRVHPGASWLIPSSGRLTSEAVPARDVLHIYRKRRPGQLRDVSWLAPVLTRLRDLSDYEAALLMKAKIEACLAAVVSEDGDEAMTGPASGLLRDAQGRTVESFEPGMILYRRGMGSVEVVNPSGGGSHAAFARRALEASAVGTGLTYDQVAGDLTQANYSSLRAGKIEFRRLCEQVQYGMLIPMLVRPIADRFHAQGALLGLWGAEVPEGLSHVPPAHEMIDPLKDTTALIAQVRAGFVPQPIVLGHEGAGVVEAVGEHVTKVQPGDHVVLTFHSCGHCRACQEGHPAFCENFNAYNFSGQRQDGSHALCDHHGDALNDRFFGQSYQLPRIRTHAPSCAGRWT